MLVSEFTISHQGSIIINKGIHLRGVRDNVQSQFVQFESFSPPPFFFLTMKSESVITCTFSRQVERISVCHIIN